MLSFRSRLSEGFNLNGSVHTTKSLRYYTILVVTTVLHANFELLHWHNLNYKGTAGAMGGTACQ